MRTFRVLPLFARWVDRKFRKESMRVSLDRWLLVSALVVGVFACALLVLKPEGSMILSQPIWQGKAESSGLVSVLSARTGEWSTGNSLLVSAGDIVRSPKQAPTQVLLRGGAVELKPGAIVELVRGPSQMEARILEGEASTKSRTLRVERAPAAPALAIPQILPRIRLR